MDSRARQISYEMCKQYKLGCSKGRLVEQFRPTTGLDGYLLSAWHRVNLLLPPLRLQLKD